MFGCLKKKVNFIIIDLWKYFLKYNVLGNLFFFIFIYYEKEFLKFNYFK